MTLFIFGLCWALLLRLRFPPVSESRGLSLVAQVRRLLSAVASLIAEHGLTGSRAHGLTGFGSGTSRALVHRLNCCGAEAWLLCGLWDLFGPGIEPVSPALAGGFITTEPPGKPLIAVLNYIF